MSTGETADPIVHLQSSHGPVSAERALVRAASDVVGVWLRLTGRGDAEHAVTVTERLPDGVDHADVGLHSAYGRRDWTRADGGLEFSTTVADPTVTMYAVRGVEVVPVELATPAVVDVRTRDRSSW